MKTNEKIRNIMLKIIVTILIGIMFFSTKSLATNEFKALEKSAEFEKWEKLKEEDRKSTIQPSYTNLSISNSIKRSTYNSLMRKVSSTPGDSYSLRDKISNIKNQQQTGLCWAFSFTSSLETTVRKKYSLDLQYSPIYTDYVVSNQFLKNIGDGANFDVALASAVSGYGLVYESDIPFSNYYNEEANSQDSYYLSYDNISLDNINSKIKINETTNFASIYKSYSENKITYKDSNAIFGGTTYTEDEVNIIRNQIKEHIKQYGAVVSHTYTQNFANDYNEDECAFYSDSYLMTTDHAITIVGWDDGYSKTNFKEGNQPINDGAYIVLNSWGEEFGDNGYYYISYDDAFIEQYVRGIDDVIEYTEEEQDYDNLYQYDELGTSIEYYFLNEQKNDYTTVGYLANVFSRKDKTKNEYISEVGIFVPCVEGIEIYVDYLNADMKDYELVASYTGTNALEPGYHAIKLSAPLQIVGDEFAIIVKYINENGAMYSIECNLNSSGLTETENYYSTAKANEGESYISIDGSNWGDINKYQIPISSTELTTYKDTNACIKAFTTYSDTTPAVPVTGVKLNNSTLSIEEGSTQTLIETVEPSTATNKNVTWSSSNQEVATVSGGVITAKTAGETIITVTTEDGQKTAECKVTVTAKEPEGIVVESVSLDKTEAILKVGETLILAETINPNNATNKRVTWSSSNGEVATVDGGVVTANSEGEATITVTTEDGEKTATCEVTVIAGEQETIGVQSVSLNKSEATLEVGETLILAETINPNNATNKRVRWSSSNGEVATVDGGVVTANSEGETTITVTTEYGGKTATCKVTVTAKQQEVIAVESVSLDKTEVTLKTRETVSLIETINPNNATNKRVRWSSSNEEVATVDGGVVTAKKAGETTITVTTEDGEKTATCKIIVADEEVATIHVQEIKLDKNTKTIQVGDTTNLVVSFTPSNPTNKNIRWESSNTNVATVSERGIITGVSEGKTIIKAISEDGNKEATCELTVVKKTNTDDDIYKDGIDDKTDDTVTDKELPNTGAKIIISIIFIVLIFGVIRFINYKKLKDIK